MATSTCSTCIVSLHTRLHARLSFLASLRSRSQVRSYKVTPETSNLAYHWDTVPPTPAQLKFATDFIETHRPRKLWVAGQWRKPSDSADRAQLIPEVAFLGRANVGKSSLLNAVLQSPGLANVGSRPGKTKTIRAWGLSASDPVTGGAGPGGKRDVRLAVLDMPGYGYQSQAEWGHEILTYLRRRKQLKRVFLLINALHGMKSTDREMISMLRDEGISCQIIVSKVDSLFTRTPATGTLAGQERLQEFFESVKGEIEQPKGGKGVAPLGEILAVGNLGDYEENPHLRELATQGMLGIEQIRWAVLVAAGVEEWITKRSGTTSDNKRRTGSTEKTSEEKRILKIPFLTNEEKRITKIPLLDPSIDTTDNSIGSHPNGAISRIEAVFAPSKKEKRRTSNIASRPPSPVEEYNPVGGLSELEAQSSSRNKSVSKHKGFDHGAGPSRIEKRGKKKGKDREVRMFEKSGRGKVRKHHMSDNLLKTRKLEKEKKIMMQRAARAKPDNQPLPPQDNTRSTWHSPTTDRDDSWPPTPPRRESSNSRQPPRPDSSPLRGVGVGNMDDLLRATEGRPPDQQSRTGVWRKWKKSGACKKAAKQKWLDKPGYKGW